MKKLHYSTKIYNEMAGRESFRRQPLSEETRQGIAVLFVWGAALLAMAAACACYIGLL